MPDVNLETLWGQAFSAQSLSQQSADAEAAVREAGFIRTLGGADAYLALFARVPGLTKDAVDSLVRDRILVVLPTVRGCIYLVHRDDRQASLSLADQLSKRRRAREYDKTGITEKELEGLQQEILDSLRKDGGQTTAALRSSLPDGSIRSLGEAGKKVGISSTLPPALRELEFNGSIERTLVGGSLDSERYTWTLNDEPHEALDPEAVAGYMAHRFFRAAGPVPLDEFSQWSGLGKRDGRGAAERVGAKPVATTQEGELWALDDAGASSGDSGVAFLPFQDNLLQLRGGAGLLVQPEHRSLVVPQWGRGKPMELGAVRHLAYRTIAVGGEVVGFWEFDPVAEAVVTHAFASTGRDRQGEVDEAAREVCDFILSEVGHAQSISIETDDHLHRRAGAIAALG